ncbi:MAG TPA: fatty acyl-AMP ligase [Thermohalobaculum sp.]|nr:fatty acyl-AMP ligase [Thermohalobaculum sp.]
MSTPKGRVTPTESALDFRPADFPTLPEALDYAAGGETGIAFHDSRGKLAELLPYAILRAQARRLAARLVAAGLAPGERAGILAESDGDFVRAFMACQYAGLVPAPLPLPTAFGGRGAYVQHLRRMLVAAGASAAFAPAALRDWLGEAADGLGIRLCGTLGDLGDLDDLAEDAALPRVGSDDLAYLQFSSGSTRFPVGVAVTQAALMANMQAIARHGLGMGPADRCTSWLPMYHDMGLIGFLLTPLATQRSLDLMPTSGFARRPLTWLQLISDNGGTLSFSPNFGYELCLRRARTAAPQGLDLSSWRGAGIGGDMIRAAVLDEFAETFAPFGFRREALVPSYGMAETTLAISFHDLGRAPVVDAVDLDRLERMGEVAPPDRGAGRARSFVGCGRVLPGHELEVRDERGRPLRDLQVGRIHVRGPSLMREYFGRPLDTQAALSGDGWLDTGDVGYLRDGMLTVTGRAKDLIIVNGRNIWPQDLEWSVEAEVGALRTGDAAAFSAESADGRDEAVVMLVQCRSADPAVRQALRDGVAAVLRARHGIEGEVVLVPHNSLPHTSSGKLSRSRARRMLLDGHLADTVTAGAA